MHNLIYKNVQEQTVFKDFVPSKLELIQAVKGKSNRMSQRDHMLGDNPVTFTNCPGPHSDIYDIDDDYSHTEPELVKKGITVAMILEGVMNQDSHVDQLHLDVYWNGNLFHSEDHKLDDQIQEQEPYELKFSWFVPGFAPSGAYIVDLIVRSAGQSINISLFVNLIIFYRVIKIASLNL